jgi:hypothetical protein
LQTKTIIALFTLGTQPEMNEYITFHVTVAWLVSRFCFPRNRKDQSDMHIYTA